LNVNDSNINGPSASRWSAEWRAEALPELVVTDWDLIVVGGGISGAGILREAARRGWKCLLIEQRDFAWGTSSRSSKMVHGGLRYIAKGQFALTRDSVRERQRLLTEAAGLVEPLSFIFPHYQGCFPGPKVFGGLLALYDALAGKRNHLYYPLQQLRYLLPGLRDEGLLGATQFFDAVTDDARLVMRVLGEARGDGGVAVNGLRVIELLREADVVVGVRVEDSETGQQFNLRSRAVAQATGAWADELRRKTGLEHIRPLRGSHLLLPAWRLPLAHALSFMHADDGRPVFVFPWEGATVIGTTDLDHAEALNRDACITVAEVDYLLGACAQQFAGAQISRTDVLSSWAGVRPVVTDGQPATAGKKPSDEKREHALWIEPGCVTLAGGKLTTFRLLALEVLHACAAFVGQPVSDVGSAVFRPQPELSLAGLNSRQQRRLAGRYGRELPTVAHYVAEVGTELVGATETLWAELAFAAEHELVLHLDDLLLRRTRLGLLLAGGAAAELPRIRQLCQARLGWDDARWTLEQQNYLSLWQRCYSLPAAHSEQ
jgi:glycerol-3-phosphate dehydrogenase